MSQIAVLDRGYPAWSADVGAAPALPGPLPVAVYAFLLVVWWLGWTEYQTRNGAMRTTEAGIASIVAQPACPTEDGFALLVTVWTANLAGYRHDLALELRALVASPKLCGTFCQVTLLCHAQGCEAEKHREKFHVHGADGRERRGKWG